MGYGDDLMTSRYCKVLGLARDSAEKFRNGAIATGRFEELPV